MFGYVLEKGKSRTIPIQWGNFATNVFAKLEITNI